jgi:hypothetical protein
MLGDIIADSRATSPGIRKHDVGEMPSLIPDIQLHTPQGHPYQRDQ